ncbi:hypothetical protein SNE40_008881 [Patella caerulea]|uniref:Uncharacterized protein n=1 Tax=Patella caerulea TaxID=87958 RepID=A0AAN8JN15_PATCE
MGSYIMLDGDDWFEVLEEVLVIRESAPATDIIVVGDSDDDDDEWLVASDHGWVRSDPFKPLLRQTRRERHRLDALELDAHREELLDLYRLQADGVLPLPPPPPPYSLYPRL